MREMDRVMGGFGPFGGFGFGSPFGSPFGMLEGPRDRGEGRNHEERGMVPRERPRDPFQSMFANMNSMMSQMHRNFVSIEAVFHDRSRFAGLGAATDFYPVKNQSRGHAKKMKCSSTSKRVRAHKNREKTLRLETCSKS